MCTCITLQTGSHYFGRTLDLEHHYRESVTITPRRFPLKFRHMPALDKHHAIIGMATVDSNYPLYYDAVNEAGLCMAGLNFPGYAQYYPQKSGCDNIAPFELIPWILGQCSTADEARELLERINLIDEAFDSRLSLTPLHWMLADSRRCIVIEPLDDGMKIHYNSVGALTNSPPFDYHMLNLSNYMNLSPDAPENRFAQSVCLKAYSRGMGAMGLPGDLSSQSRFVRAAFGRLNSVCGNSEEESVSQFFHILGSVSQTRGCVQLDSGNVITVYSSCCNAERGVYYYTTYEDSRVKGVDMHREQLDGAELISYPVSYEGQLEIIN